jgi:hypothetical protein
MSVRRFLTPTCLFGVVLLAGVAQSAVLFTPPLVPDGSNVLDCYLTNVSEKTRQVTIKVLNRFGEDVVEPVSANLNPGEERVATAEASDDPSEAPRYCKFVVEGARSDYRGSALVRKEGEGSISALPAQ